MIVFYAVFAGSEVTAMIFPPLRYATDAAKMIVLNGPK
ncbi:hypothetical protein M988_1254 [Hafnia paralvei ATCC 29927]|nr:hypothetical protein M988_1254 [Hafnia paralvei ATCC 29927]